MEETRIKELKGRAGNKAKYESQAKKKKSVKLFNLPNCTVRVFMGTQYFNQHAITMTA